ncbi:MAG TPA: hypothetical protein VE056_02950 [Pyrinomonadaceae bacterium]|nr:hypothetical protein [Pyrinomonadaceae bacterium]
MSTKEPTAQKRSRTFDSAYIFSFAIALGLILFIAGLIISLTLGNGTSIGLIFGIPLLVAGLILPLFMMRDLFKQNEVSGPCPYCDAPIRTSDATLSLMCPNCKNVVMVRDMKLCRSENSAAG